MTDSNPTTSSERPRSRQSRTPARALARLAVDAMLAKKAVDITVIDVHSVSGVTDFYVIATGQSDLQVRAIVDGIDERVREETGERPWKREGADHLQWVVLDYVDVVVHVFDAERRAFYDLERLWSDAPTEHVVDDGSPVKLLADA
jgi:ribosome-associated protein